MGNTTNKITQKISRTWAQQHPDEVARLIEGFSPAEKREVFTILTTNELVPIIRFMHPLSITEVLNELPPQEVSKILESIPIKRAFVIFQQLSNEVRQKLDVHLSSTVHKQLQKLGSYPPDSVGRLGRRGSLESCRWRSLG